jgi:hypothetical protein
MNESFTLASLFIFGIQDEKVSSSDIKKKCSDPA